MFEKEAEEYFENECLHSYADTEEELKEDVAAAFKDGAEFGYNKAKEEVKTTILELRNCENCKYHSFWGDELKCNYGLKEALQEDKLVECHNLDKWEMKE